MAELANLVADFAAEWMAGFNLTPDERTHAVNLHSWNLHCLFSHGVSDGNLAVLADPRFHQYDGHVRGMP